GARGRRPGRSVLAARATPTRLLPTASLKRDPPPEIIPPVGPDTAGVAYPRPPAGGRPWLFTPGVAYRLDRRDRRGYNPAPCRSGGTRPAARWCRSRRRSGARPSSD